MMYFKHEERPVLAFPHKLVLGRPQADELNRGSIKVNVAFTLPPGAYATLVVKRLFHFNWREDTADEIRASQRPRFTETLEAESAEAPGRSPRGFSQRGATTQRASTERSRAFERAPLGRSRATSERAPTGRSRAPERAPEPREPAPAPSAPEPSPGFRERQRVKKAAKVIAQAETASRAAGKPAKSQKKK